MGDSVVIEGQPLPYYQPLIDTATGRIAGYEALARLRKDNDEVVSAGPLFSDSQVDQAELLQLDRQVRRMALEHFQATPTGFISLNISPKWLSKVSLETPLPSLVLLEQVGLPPEKVVFEISGLQGDVERLSKVVALYRAAGIRVAVDDFGTGYSMLDQVIALEPDFLKLDIQLLHQVTRCNRHSSDFVKSLALMAEKSGCWIIAEGVETEEHLHFALDCGARYVQGYLFAAAEEGFLQEDAIQPLFSHLRDQYVQAKLAERGRFLELRKLLASLFGELRDWLEKGGKPNTLRAPVEYPWLLRFFLCDAYGSQISPNYEWDGERWQQDPQYLDHNWSWRPYFYRILAESDEDSRVILSSRYRDASSSSYCMTSGLFIDEGRHLLLVDIDVERLEAAAAESPLVQEVTWTPASR